MKPIAPLRLPAFKAFLMMRAAVSPTYSQRTDTSAKPCWPLSKAKEILELPLTTDDDDFASILRAQVSSIQTVFNAQLRADEGRLRARALDMMPKILERMAQEEKKLLLLERGVLQ